MIKIELYNNKIGQVKKRIHHMLNDYGIGSNIQNRKVMKSPQPGTASLKVVDDAKNLKRKYQEVKHLVIQKKEQNSRLQQKLKQMQELYDKRQKQIDKKDSIVDALLYQIKSLNELKTQASLKSLSIQNSKSPKNNYSADVPKPKLQQTHFSTASEDESKQSSAQKVGGYFGKVFK